MTCTSTVSHPTTTKPEVYFTGDGTVSARSYFFNA